jgi:NAD+ kinase
MIRLERVAIFSQDRSRRTVDCVNQLIKEMCARGTRLQIHEKTGEEYPCSGAGIEKFRELGDLAELPDLVLSVGGDGTYLETMLMVRKPGIPIAGVNTGRLGFLANIPGDGVPAALDRLYGGNFVIMERSLLEVYGTGALFGERESFALNEITIQKSDLTMITINVFVNDLYLNTYWADGIIVSTATGSTAYNLSSGGPILTPEDRSIIISPISPHNLTIRPIVLSGNSSLRMVVGGRGDGYLVTSDFRWKKIPFTESVFVRQSDERLKTVMLTGTDFFTTLRTKLMWGADNRN